LALCCTTLSQLCNEKRPTEEQAKLARHRSLALSQHEMNFSLVRE
jgi:hypothetical protein